MNKVIEHVLGNRGESNP